MAKRKKVTRKQLLKEPDEFLTFSAKLLQFISRHRRIIVFSASAILLIVAGVSGFRYYSLNMEKKAFRALSETLAKYEAADGQNNPQSAYLAVHKDFDALIQTFGGRRGGHFAIMHYANICYRSGQIEKALTLYNQALKFFNDRFLRSQLWMNIGYAHQYLGEYEQAVTHFEKVVTAGDPALAAEARFNLSLSYAAMGQNDKRVDSLQQIVDNHADHMYFDMVAEQLAGA